MAAARQSGHGSPSLPLPVLATPPLKSATATPANSPARRKRRRPHFPPAGDEEEEKSEDSGDPSPPIALRPRGHLLSRIFSQLDCIDLLCCSLVCKQWYRDSAELREAWKNEYMEAYYQLGLGIERKTHPPSSIHKWCALLVPVILWSYSIFFLLKPISDLEYVE